MPLLFFAISLTDFNNFPSLQPETISTYIRNKILSHHFNCAAAALPCKVRTSAVLWKLTLFHLYSCRLPIIQGSSTTFVAVIVAMRTSSYWPCDHQHSTRINNGQHIRCLIQRSLFTLYSVIRSQSNITFLISSYCETVCSNQTCHAKIKGTAL